MILSLFSGCGGLDLGFEEAGFNISLAYEKRPPAVESYNHNRKAPPSAIVRDISQLTIEMMDADFNGEFAPNGVIGGPPCQSFSKANRSKIDHDPRTALVNTFFNLALQLHQSRKQLDFIVMENVPELLQAEKGALLNHEITRLEQNGFDVFTTILDASTYGVAQTRKRLFLVALNNRHGKVAWTPPPALQERYTVGDKIRHFPEPAIFERGLRKTSIGFHPNHWCMKPKSKRFTDGSLIPGRSSGRCFKTLSWDKPSYTASYGNREVHIHPDCTRRLSVYEAMILQGFPTNYVLKGTMSAQFSQVSEAVPPPLAAAIARSVATSIFRSSSSPELLVG